MSRCWAVVALVALAGCKERNPEWLGPAAETGSGSTSTTGAPSSSSSGDESSSGGPMPCNNDNQCPDDLVCGPQFCQRGIEGDPCNRSRNCAAAAPICSSAGICQDGSSGDPCSNAGDCVGTCEGEVCV